MSLIKCKECGNEISNKAQKCPRCGIPLSNNSNGNTVRKILAFIFGFMLLIIGLSMSFNGTSKILETSNDSSYSQSSSKITLDKFNQIQTGMTYEEVVDIIGENGTIFSEVDIDIGLLYITKMYYWF